METVVTAAPDYAIYLSQLHLDALAIINAEYALIVILAAAVFFCVFFRGGR